MQCLQVEESTELIQMKTIRDGKILDKYRKTYKCAI